ncbi:iron-sulfur cluster carrier protein ApbC [Pelistega sp. NLN82]|uniref:Iron-sulfur cluster carrier protein n=1 Tax=Pelistega ratti TaxID=2652177 RepID=A0A6L9Y879_9BURK|nr:iron-sulfur cluster carrier protein ApbC [Pelistega ratti]NEN76077.1 iron-sulfur cluster carrier protein ApbC [Pelistega ratti]
MSATLNSTHILEQLKVIKDPLIGEVIGHNIKASDIHITGTSVAIQFDLGYYLSTEEQQDIQKQCIECLSPLGISQVNVSFIGGVQIHKVQDGLKPIETIKNIIAVASGKGGVGKSTTSVNLAVALAQSGARVGILDADIYGPSQPLLLGVKGKPELNAKQHMIPPKAHGVWVNSFGFLVEENRAAIWRGPMVVQAMNQLLSLTEWPDLDYLIVDMPPGTGDIALSLAQKVPVVGAVIVTTPQDIALLDVRKGVSMFQTVNVPVLGIVENMSVHICSQCGHAEHIFGQDGGKALAESQSIDYLGGLPLDIKVREQSDGGVPIVAADPQSKISLIYRQMARRLALNIASLQKDTTHKFPPIVIKR